MGAKDLFRKFLGHVPKQAQQGEVVTFANDTRSPLKRLRYILLEPIKQTLSYKIGGLQRELSYIMRAF